MKRIRLILSIYSRYSRRDVISQCYFSLEKMMIGSMILTLLGWIPLANAQSTRFHTIASLISEKRAVTLGESFDVGILLKMEPDWHTYWENPGDSGLPTSVEWKLPKGFTAGPIRWPKPKAITLGRLTSYGYEDEVLLLVHVQAPLQGYDHGQAVRLEGEVSWLECKDVCIPGSAIVFTTLRIGKVSENAPAQLTALFEKYRALIPGENLKFKARGAIKTISQQTSNFKLQTSNSLWRVLPAAFLGGLILNFMPCVLPVIAIKILGFVKQSHDAPHHARRLGWMFGLGVLVSFWILAALVIGLRLVGSQVGWGFQFQEPRFLIVMALVVTVVALNFFGVFEFELASDTLHTAGYLVSQEGYRGAFFNGVLATTLATPCTAPFLAPALGFAFSQNSLTIFAIFSTVGIGLALPYIVLAWDPKLLKWLPKPGAWMLRFKQAMGFPMLATSLWLIWILGTSYGINIAFLIAGWFMVISFVIWLVNILASGRFFWVALGLVTTAVIGYLHISSSLLIPQSAVRKSVSSSLNDPQSAIDWQPYSKSALEAALKTDRPIFIDFTADWCLNCQVNKQTSLEVPRVSQRIKELRVTTFLADWTRPNNEILEALRSFDQSGVPLYVIYPADRKKPPIILPQILTPQIVLDALNQAASKKLKVES